MAKKVVTLYIDDNNLRLLVAEGNQIKKWANLPLESGLVQGGIVLDEAKLAAKIKELLKAQGVKTEKVIVGLSGLHCLTRVLVLPKLPRAVLAGAVRQEAESALPVPLEQLYISWQIIRVSEEEIQVFLATLPCNAADALIATLRKAGVKPYLMDLKPLAVARVVKQGTAVIVDVQLTEFDIIVMVDGVPHPIRTVSLPSEGLSLQERLPTVREELERTIKFYNSSHPEKPLEPDLPIFVSGELADEPGLCQSLADKLKHPVLPLSSPLECPGDLTPSQYMVNIGLALKEMSLPEAAVNFSVVNLNVLPEVYRPKPVALTRLAGTFAAPIIILLAIGLLFPVITRVQNAAAYTASLQAHLAATSQLLKQRQTQMQSQNEVIAELEKKVAEAEAVYKAFDTVLTNFRWQRGRVNGDLGVAVLNLPSTVDLSSMAHASVELTINGMSPSETEVLAYADHLRASNKFSQVIVSRIVETEEGMSFTLTLTSKE